MIRINLLPFRAARTKENVRRQISIFCLIIILIIVGMAAITLALKKEQAAWSQKVTSVQQELSKYTEKANEAKRLREEARLLQTKIDIIAKLQLIRKEPVALFTALTEVVVAERMWITAFEMKESKIKITGVALDEITIADFTKRLELSKVFDKVVLAFLKQGAQKNVSVKNFEINCVVGTFNEEAQETISKKGAK